MSDTNLKVMQPAQGGTAVGAIQVNDSTGTAVVISKTTPVDQTGAALGQTGNPMVVQEAGPNSSQTASNTLPPFTPTVNSGAGTITAAATDQAVLAANPTRKFLQIENTGTADLWFNPAGAAWNGTTYVGIRIPGSGARIYDVKVPNSAIHLASATAGTPFFILEG